MPETKIAKLRHDVIDVIKRRFVGRDEVVDLIVLASVAGEHLFLHGPPGTAKSAIIRQFAEAVRGEYFEYLLTRFSEPNEIFGPIDLARLREGTVATVTKGMLPEARFVFLDELFNANSAILNNLLSVLNERVYRRGAETHRLPLLSLFAASNHVPEDDALRALFDRFLLRCHVDQLPRDSMPRLLAAGWELEGSERPETSITAEDLRQLGGLVREVNLGEITSAYADLIFKIRDLGIALSDRRAVKLLKLVAASSILCGRKTAAISDLWILRYVWDREEQIGPLGSLVTSAIGATSADHTRHPLSEHSKRLAGDEIAKELDAVDAEIGQGGLRLAAVSRLRERVTDLADQAAWIAEQSAREHLLERTSRILRRIG